jgi:surfeit locus 1 family protein
MPIRFKFRWIPFIAAMLAMTLGISLGRWQLGRADEKRAIELRMAAQDAAPELSLNAKPDGDTEQLEYRRVLVRGEFREEWTVYLDNRPHRGRAGFYVVTPLRIADSDRHVLVARGWLPRDPADRARIIPVAAPAGIVEVRGMARRDPGQVLQLGTAGPVRPGAILQNLDIAAIGKAAGMTLLPFVVEQAQGSDSLVRDWPRPSSGVDKHLGYAFQWFALAATAMLFFIFTGFRGTRREQPTD